MFCSPLWSSWPALVPIRALGVQISGTAGVLLGVKHLSLTWTLGSWRFIKKPGRGCWTRNPDLSPCSAPAGLTMVQPCQGEWWAGPQGTHAQAGWMGEGHRGTPSISRNLYPSHISVILPHPTPTHPLRAHGRRPKSNNWKDIWVKRGHQPTLLS